MTATIAGFIFVHRSASNMHDKIEQRSQFRTIVFQTNLVGHGDSESKAMTVFHG